MRPTGRTLLAFLYFVSSLVPSAHPPPTNCTISNRSPPTTFVSSHFAFGKISRLSSMATRQHAIPNDPAIRARSFPRAIPSALHSPAPGSIAPDSSSHRRNARLRPQSIPQRRANSSAVHANHQRHVAAGQFRHVEGNGRAPHAARPAGMNGGRGASLNLRADLHAFRRLPARFLHGNVQRRLLAHQPIASVQ